MDETGAKSLDETEVEVCTQSPDSADTAVTVSIT